MSEHAAQAMRTADLGGFQPSDNWLAVVWHLHHAPHVEYFPVWDSGRRTLVVRWAYASAPRWEGTRRAGSRFVCLEAHWARRSAGILEAWVEHGYRIEHGPGLLPSVPPPAAQRGALCGSIRNTVRVTADGTTTHTTSTGRTESEQE